MPHLRKRTLVAATVAAIVLCHPSAFAGAFSDFIDFGDPGLGPDNTGSISLFDTDAPQWLHDITDTLGGLPAGLTIPDATITLSFRGTDGSELWSLFGDGIALGNLSVTTKLLTQEFLLPPMALSALAADGKLNVALVESTSSRDGIGLYETTLAGTYALPQTAPPTSDPVPAPELPTVWYLLPFLAALVGAGSTRAVDANAGV